MKWFKFYGQDWLTDPKIVRMSVEDRLCFITLLCLASAADEDGLVRNCDEQSLIELTRLRENPLDDDNEYTRALGCLKRYEALRSVTLHDNGDVTVLNFGKRQGENLTNAERQKNYRERLKIKPKSRYKSNIGVTTNVTLDKNRIDKKREEENIYGEFQNVLLTPEEHTNLVEALNPEAVTGLIAELDGYIESTGKKYKSHYATLQNWARRRIKDFTIENRKANKPKRQII